ncbi:MAG: DUF3604 domain-containing protein [Acidobacteria bacterium]|nr:DUF3604 domain-containing protein [Acidobacteriota bacterium]
MSLPRRAAAGVVASLAVLSIGCRQTSESAPADRDLNRQIAQLIADIEREPTSAANVFRRTDTLWDWANRFALDGRVLPADLPLAVALIRFAEADGGEVDLPPAIDLYLETHLERFDRYVRELELKESEPQAVGELRMSTPGPLIAGGAATVEQTYIVGSRGLAAGGGLLVGKSGTGNETRPQNRDPAGDNFVSVRSSNPDARFEAVQVEWNGVHSHVPGKRPLPGFRLEGSALQPGDTVTLTYGGGSSRFHVPAFSNDEFVLPVYVDIAGSGTYLTPALPGIEVVGEPEVHAVRILAPSVVAAAEPFEITVRSEDRAINRASGPIPAYEVLLEGDTIATIEGGQGALSVVEGIAIEVPGVHRLEARSLDGSLHASSNPIRVELEPELRIYWGDTHGHTGLAEGTGSARAFFEYANRDARLDFATLSEHDIWMDDREWLDLQELTREFTEEGRFIGILGYEWTAFRNRGGHHNVFFRDPGSRRVPVQEATRLPDLYRGLHELYDPDEVLVIPHAHRAADWTRSDPELEKLVELYSVHGSFEWFANRYLQSGFELGFVAASDDHHAKPGLAPGPVSSVSQPGGLAAVVAPELSRDALFSALRNLSSYATSGQRILLEATVNGAAMGTRQENAERREIRVRVSGTSPIDAIDVVRNGEIILTKRYMTAALGSRSWLQVSFESSSEVFGEQVDNPRGYRLWEGTLEVEGARVLQVVPAGLDNPLRDQVSRLAPGAGHGARFRILTRGRSDSFLVELDGAGPHTLLSFHLNESTESGFAPGIRPAARIAAANVAIRLDELEAGRLDVELPVGPHPDRLSVQVIDPAAALDREVEFVDLDGVQDGDYYYVRVTQLDGGRAWSSPFWVGNRPASNGGQ